jgi:hypothetical protein
MYGGLKNELSVRDDDGGDDDYGVGTMARARAGAA